MNQRILNWDGCINVRDLGGIPTREGGLTRRGAIVRSDTPARLTPAGLNQSPRGAISFLSLEIKEKY